jgi:hypothetical protein
MNSLYGSCIVVFLFALFPIKLKANDFVGTWKGPVDGGVGELVLSKTSGNAIDVKLTLGGDGCSGFLEGSGLFKDKSIIVKVKNESNEGSCQLTLLFLDKGLEMKSENCSEFHGAACAFESYKGYFQKFKLSIN